MSVRIWNTQKRIESLYAPFFWFMLYIDEYSKENRKLVIFLQDHYDELVRILKRE